MPNYQPYLIGDFKLGQYAGQEPWLAPEAAFKTLTNGYVYRGQLVKRGGYEQFCSYGTPTPGETDLEIMGFWEHKLLDGTNALLVLNSDRLFRLESGSLVDRGGGVLWAGGDSDFFSFATADNEKTYIVNGVVGDSVTSYDNGTPTVADVGASLGLSDDIKAAKWVLFWKGRLWLFSTTEGAGNDPYPQRARFSAVNQPETFADADFIEATTSELMTGVGIVGDRVIVTFEDSTWALEEIGEFRLPFRFRRIPSSLGGVGAHANFATDEELVSLARFGMTSTNGDQVSRIDEALPFLIDRLNPGKAAYAYGGREPRLRQGWINFVNAAETLPVDQLVFNWQNGAFAFYNLPMHVFGRYRASDTVTWDGLGSDPIDDYPDSFDSYGGTSEIPIMLGGDRDGVVWQLNRGVRDGVTASAAGNAYTMTARTMRLNPFKGMRARLGYIDVYAKASSSQLRVKSIQDGKSSPSTSVDISLAPSGSEEKVMRRVMVNRTAGFHQIELEHSEAAEAEIDGLRLWMAPVAGGRAF